jgi:hypothetical protein
MGRTWLVSGRVRRRDTVASRCRQTRDIECPRKLAGRPLKLVSLLARFGGDTEWSFRQVVQVMLQGNENRELA